METRAYKDIYNFQLTEWKISESGNLPHHDGPGFRPWEWNWSICKGQSSKGFRGTSCGYIGDYIRIMEKNMEARI